MILFTGVDMWLKLHSKLVCTLPNFQKTPKDCKKKFNDVYEAYKEDKRRDNISGGSHHGCCKAYDCIVTWYHQNGFVPKHVSASFSDMPSAEDEEKEMNVEDSESVASFTSMHSKAKIKYQERVLELMGQFAENMKNMAQSMQVANKFLSNFDKHMERLIEKL